MKIVKKSHIQVGDQVQVKAGSYKKTIGIIVWIDKKKALAILDTIKPRDKKVKLVNGDGNNIKRIPTAIAISNLMLWDNKAPIPTASRIGWREATIQSKLRIRYFKKTGNLVNEKND